MKTAMQELIDELKYQFSHSDNHLQTIVDIVQKAENELFEKEKEQIMNAYENGVGDENERNLSGKFTNAEEYYNQTYNQNK